MTNAPARVVVTGMSVRSPLGEGLHLYGNALAEGRSAIAPITRFDTEGMPCRLAAQCAPVRFEEHLEPEEIRRYDPMANAASVLHPSSSSRPKSRCAPAFNWWLVAAGSCPSTPTTTALPAPCSFRTSWPSASASPPSSSKRARWP